jgi:nucleotidyltransferase substrate binding protein (TIGR01987 family)
MGYKIKWHQKFENLERAFLRLTEAIDRIKQNMQDNLLVAGFIQTYEFTLELAWKTLKDYLEEQGFIEIESPKKVLRTAFKEGFIKDCELWLKAVDDRNLTSHIYNEEIAKQVITDILEKYYFIIQDLYFILKENKNDE